MPATDKIEKQIRAAIEKIPGQLKNGEKDGAWTKAVFKSLSELGESLGYDICSSSSAGEYDAGWLYDLIWYENDAHGQLKDVSLILESEWHLRYDRIKYDFEKLLVGRAKFKVMIFQASEEKMVEYFGMMKKGIKAFEGSSGDEYYLLACFIGKRWGFEIETIKIT
jgi:hypothetical protein